MFQLEKAHMILDGACCATARTFGWVGGWVYGGGRRTRAYVCLHSDAARAAEVWLRSPASLFACMLVAHARRAQSLTPTAALLDATPPPPHPPALHADARTRGPWACTRARLSCSHYRDGYGWLSRRDKPREHPRCRQSAGHGGPAQGIVLGCARGHLLAAALGDCVWRPREDQTPPCLLPTPHLPPPHTRHTNNNAVALSAASSRCCAVLRVCTCDSRAKKNRRWAGMRPRTRWRSAASESFIVERDVRRARLVEGCLLLPAAVRAVAVVVHALAVVLELLGCMRAHRLKDLLRACAGRRGGRDARVEGCDWRRGSARALAGSDWRHSRRSPTPAARTLSTHDVTAAPASRHACGLGSFCLHSRNLAFSRWHETWIWRAADM